MGFIAGLLKTSASFDQMAILAIIYIAALDHEKEIPGPELCHPGLDPGTG